MAQDELNKSDFIQNLWDVMNNHAMYCTANKERS